MVQKNAAEECCHWKAKKFDERHCNTVDMKFSAYGMDKPAEVAHAAVLNGDTLHPEHLICFAQALKRSPF